MASTQADVKQAHSKLGRTGQLPWLVSEIQALHPYLEADSLLLVPPAHNLLRGPIKSLLSFALKTKPADLDKMGINAVGHPVVFTSNQRRNVEVSVFAPAHDNYVSCTCARGRGQL